MTDRMPGYGDPETWPALATDPQDPRYEPTKLEALLDEYDFEDPRFEWVLEIVQKHISWEDIVWSVLGYAPASDLLYKQEAAMREIEQYLEDVDEPPYVDY